MNRKKWAADPETYQKKAVETGLIYPIEENCKRCHKKEGNLNFKKFDFSRWKSLVHVMKPGSTSVKKAPKPTPTSSEEAKKPADTTSKK